MKKTAAPAKESVEQEIEQVEAEIVEDPLEDNEK